MSENDRTGDPLDDDPVDPIPEDDPLLDNVDGETVVVPGQRPGPTEPLPT